MWQINNFNPVLMLYAVPKRLIPVDSNQKRITKQHDDDHVAKYFVKVPVGHDEPYTLV